MQEPSMSKFNVPTVTARTVGAITTTGPAATFEGGPGFARTAKSDLFLLAVTNMVGENTFYEKAGARDARFEQLVHQVAVLDSDWMGRFVPWLRSEANMRSASLVAACESVKARLDAGLSGNNRQLIDAACQRADEPGEVLAYWTSRHGRTVPMPVKRGIGDAVRRLYSGKSLLKYDTDSKGYRFGDVLNLVHPAPHPDKPWQGELFRYALDRRHHPDTARLPEGNFTLAARQRLMDLPVERRREYLLSVPDVGEKLAEAGMTWEALSGWLQGPMDKDAWEAIIPSMGIMALSRNLRNFDEAGVSDRVAATVASKFADPEQVAKSRMFPYRWLSAYLAAPSLRWGHALEQALSASTSAIPDLPGRTLVLVDTSGSMTNAVSARSKVAHLHIGALIGAALAGRGCDVDLVGFADGTFRHPLTKGGSALRDIDAFCRRSGEVGHGTRMVEAIQATYNGHDRVIIVSDMQAFPVRSYNSYGRTATVSEAVPAHVPMFGLNTTGYAAAVIDSSRPNRFEVGGFSDKVFTMFAALSAGKGDWPF
jgi:TROVE domain